VALFAERDLQLEASYVSSPPCKTRGWLGRLETVDLWRFRTYGVRCVAVPSLCCSALQSAAVCGSVWQCVAVCGGVWRCVAVCGGVWRCAAECLS